MQYVEDVSYWYMTLVINQCTGGGGLFNILSTERITGDDVDLENGRWCITKARTVGEQVNKGIILISKLGRYFVGIKLRIMQACKDGTILKLGDRL